MAEGIYLRIAQTGMARSSLLLTDIDITAAGPGFVNYYSTLFKDSVFKNHLSLAVTSDIQRTSHQAWSLAFWVKINTLKASDFYSWGPNGNDKVYIGMTAGGAIRALLQKTSSKAVDVSAGTLGTGAWHHIVVTNSGSGTAAGIKVYVDGAVQVNTVAQDNLAAASGSGSVAYIARASGAIGDAHWLDSYIDCMSYWNVALTAGNVTTLYNLGVPFDISTAPFAANLKAWWRMGDAGDAYPNLWDHAPGGANHATMVNMTGLNIMNITP